jgi:AcrR family transcriptional regulator
MPRHRFTDTRDRIEAAAIELFVAKGVAETTVKDIAGALGLSEGALYRHFISKEQLVWQVFERHYVDFGEQLLKLAEKDTTARAKLTTMIRAFCSAHDDNPTLFRFLLFVQHGQLAKLSPDSPTPVLGMRKLIEKGIASGEIPDQDPDLATALVFGIVLQPAQFAAYGRVRSSMTSVCDRIVAASWAALTTVTQEIL